MSPHASARRAQPGAVIRRDLGSVSTVTAVVTCLALALLLLGVPLTWFIAVMR